MTAAAMPVAVREPAVVAVDGLHKAWGRGAARRPALVDVRLWAAGGVVAVLGPNGAGKTTLLRCLATLVAPDRGTVHVDGLDVGVPDQRQDVRSRLGYVPQRPAFSAGSRAFDVVDVLAACKGLGPDLRLAWRTPSGWWRCLGRPPAGAALAEPTLEDAYLLLVGPAGHA